MTCEKVAPSHLAFASFVIRMRSECGIRTYEDTLLVANFWKVINAGDSLLQVWPRVNSAQRIMCHLCAEPIIPRLADETARILGCKFGQAAEHWRIVFMYAAKKLDESIGVDPWKII